MHLLVFTVCPWLFFSSIKNLQWPWWHGNYEYWITVEADIFQRVWRRLRQLHLCRHQQTRELKHKLPSVWWVKEYVFGTAEQGIKRCSCRLSEFRYFSIVLLSIDVIQSLPISWKLLHKKNQHKKTPIISTLYCM